MCRRRVFKDGEIFHYQGGWFDGHNYGGVICSTCWEKTEGDE